MTYAQHGEDDFVLAYFDCKPGVFCDIGASDGISLSNTYLLEQRGWRGACFEPVPGMFENLKNSRKVAHCVNCVVWNKDGVVDFDVMPEQIQLLSGIKGTVSERRILAEYKLHSKTFTSKRHRIKIESITGDQAMEIAEEMEPGPLTERRGVDFLSIDTEGTELVILQSIDWKIHRPKLVCVEDNALPGDYVTNENTVLRNLMASVGYQRCKTLGHCNDFFEPR